MQTQKIETHTKKRTRADFYRDQVEVRLAVDEAGPLIAALLKENGIELPGCDWAHVFPSWLIATQKDDVIGCLQVTPVKPVGYVNFLHVKSSATFKMRAIAIRKLALAALSTMHYAGVDYVAGFVNPGNKKFLNVLEKLKFAKLSSGMIVIRHMSGLNLS